MRKFMMTAIGAAGLALSAQPAAAAVQITSILLYNGDPTGNCADTLRSANCSPLGVTAAGSTSNPFLNNINTKTVALDKGSYYIFGNPWAGTNFMTAGDPISIYLELKSEDGSFYSTQELFDRTVPDLSIPGKVLFSFRDLGITISTTGITDADRMSFGTAPGAFNADGRTDFVLRLDYGVTPPPVPEPASWAMMIAGLSLIGGAMRRQRTQVRFA